MNNFLLLLLGFFFSIATFGSVILYALYDGKKYSGDRKKRFQSQLALAGVKLSPGGYTGTYHKRQYEFAFTTGDCPTIRIETPVQNKQGVMFHSIHTEDLRQESASSTGNKRQFMMVSDPPRLASVLLKHCHQLHQLPHIEIRLDENTLTIFPNVLDDNTVDIFEWRLYMDLLGAVAKAVEQF